MRESKNRHFYHIFVSPGDAPGAITLNVAWIERKFDAYKLPRCIIAHLTITVSEIERDIGENNGRKAGFLIRSLHSTPPGPFRGVPVEISPFGTKKLEWCLYPMGW